jgi:hypothetical protein
VCFPNSTFANQQCMCAKAAECSSGSCGKTSNALGNPTKAWVCQPNDGKAYHGCNGSVTCTGGYCCVGLTGTGGSICEEPCQNASQCGGASCQILTSGTCNGSPGRCQ